MAVTVRLYGSAREALGARTTQVPAGPLSELCQALAGQAADPRRLAAILAVSALLCDGVRYRAADDVRLPDGSTLEVLPPVAGG